MNDLGEGARMEFRLAGGKLGVERLKIFSKLVETTGHGFYDIAEDRLEKFSMKQNLIGPVGVPFMLVSEMLEVEGSGSLKAPVWTPKNFDGK
jgi:uroporphyrinogen-III decarboxylase